MAYNNYINKFSSSEEIQAAIESGDLLKPYVAMIEDESGNTSIDFNTQEAEPKTARPLKFIKTQSSTYGKIWFNPLDEGMISEILPDVSNSFPDFDITISASTDGENWTEYSTNVATGEYMFGIDVDEPYDYIYIKGNNDYLTKYDDNNNCIMGYSIVAENIDGGDWDIEGDITSLCGGPSKASREYQYAALFAYSNNQIINASGLTLDAELVKPYMYAYMFTGVDTLVTGPLMPATSVDQHCYDYMFYNCSRLKEVTNLAGMDNPYFENWLGGTTEYTTGILNCLQGYRNVWRNTNRGPSTLPEGWGPREYVPPTTE